MDTRKIGLFFLLITVSLFNNVHGQMVVGGDIVEDGQYPFMVGLLNSGDQNNLVNALSCGASLIHPKWVMTAAHCVHDQQDKDFHIILGATDLAKPGARARIVKVKKIHLHPDFHWIDYDIKGHPLSIPENDIALLELTEPLVAPTVELPEMQDDAYNLHGLKCQMMGWGNTTTQSNGQMSRHLKDVNIEVIERSVCLEYPIYEDLVSESMLCAGLLVRGSPRGGAQGDSGGPLVLLESNKWKQIGLMSWGMGYTQYKEPAVYQNISSHVNWIRDLVGITTSNVDLKELGITLSNYGDHYIIHSEVDKSLEWAIYSMTGQILQVPGTLRPQAHVRVEKTSSQPMILVFSDHHNTWTQVIR